MAHPGILMWAVVALELLVYEAWALMTGHESLSRAMWLLSKWTPFVWILGVVIGGLASHFWWRWDPDKTNKGA